MNEGFAPIGRLLMLVGLLFLALGAVLAFGARIPWLGRLPGDFTFEGPGWKVYLPLGTCLLLSLVGSLLLWLWSRRG